MNKKNSAFTLVELAIVIVIIGLLIAGVLQGQELIKQSKYRSTWAQHQGFMAATAAFFSKYNALPGDINRGYMFFGDPVDCLNIPVSRINNGCNGDGDGQYNNVDAEGLLYWKHLSKAKLINGYYTGVVTGAIGTTDCCVKGNINVPAGPFEGSAYWLRMTNESANGVPTAAANYISSNNHYRFAKIYFTGTDNWAWSPIFTPVEAYEFDDKFDDGNPVNGNITGTSSGSCLTGSNTYNTALNTQQCYMFFIWNSMR